MLGLIHIEMSLWPGRTTRENHAQRRTLALVQVNAKGQVVWKQDEGLSDESPLNLEQAKIQIDILSKSPQHKNE